MMTESSSPNNAPLTFVGFGFGAIQAGLFAYEAYRSQRFGRIVIAEVVDDVVDAVTRAKGRYGLNIARRDRIECVEVGPIEILNPRRASDRAQLLEAIEMASEIATAVPSVAFYRSASEASLHQILADGLRRRAATAKPDGVIVYAAENHHAAAQVLQEAVLEAVPEGECDVVLSVTRFVNTVIGKMSAVITDRDAILDAGLKTVTAEDPRAFLVEEFRHILIDRIEPSPAHAEPGGFARPQFRRGIAAFEEKDDLHPFEEAKLYGHNATHAVAAYLAARLSCERLEELRSVDGAREFLLATLSDECGAALRAAHGGTDDLFTEAGWSTYAVELLDRMLNPHLGDLVERVARDPARKLAWDDRLIGALRLALRHGVQAPRLALGAAAALRYYQESTDADGTAASADANAARLERNWAEPSEALREIWRAGPTNADELDDGRVVEAVRAALERLEASAADASSVDSSANVASTVNPFRLPLYQ